MKLSFLSNKQILFFMHIPKTAGTTVNEFVIARLDNKASNLKTDYFYKLNTSKLSLEEKKNYKFITGHVKWRILKGIESEVISFTVLRDPLERAVSQYNQIKKSYALDKHVAASTNYDKELHILFGINNTVELKDALDDMNFLKKHICNLQCVQISDKDLSINEPIEDYLSTEILDNALNNLEKFTFVGIQDDMYGTMLKLCYYCGFRPMKNVGKRNISKTNTSKQVEALSQTCLKKIDTYIKNDIAVYNKAVQLHQQQMEGITYETVLENYENVVSQHYQIKDINNYNDESIRYSSGWYSIDEHNARWSGPETESYIDFSLKTPAKLKCSFEVNNCLEKGILESLKIFVNDIEIKQIIKRDNSIYFNISKETISGNMKMTSIKLLVKNTVSPREMNMGADVRKLGIYIRNFSLKVSN